MRGKEVAILHLQCNGNVSEIIDDTGSVLGHYEYDSFGKIIKMNGLRSDANSIRFSSKYYDDELTLYNVLGVVTV